MCFVYVIKVCKYLLVIDVERRVMFAFYIGQVHCQDYNRRMYTNNLFVLPLVTPGKFLSFHSSPPFFDLFPEATGGIFARYKFRLNCVVFEIR
jgi:hypothetical protein